jgi:hypothetical protein
MFYFECFEKIRNQEFKFDSTDFKINDLISIAIRDTKWATMFHIQSLAFILNRPIYCYGKFERINKNIEINELCERVKNGEYCGNHFKYKPFSEHNHLPPILLYFHYSHFDAILAENEKAPIIVPKHFAFTWS